MLKTIILCLTLLCCPQIQAQDLSPEATCNNLVELIRASQKDGSLKETEEKIQYLGHDYPVYSLNIYNKEISILGETLSKSYDLYSKKVFSEVKTDVQMAGFYYPGIFAKKGSIFLKMGILMYVFKNFIESSTMLSASPLGEINYLLLGRTAIITGAILILLDIATDKDILCNQSKTSILTEHPSMIIYEVLNNKASLIHHMNNDDKVLHAVRALEAAFTFAKAISNNND